MSAKIATKLESTKPASASDVAHLTVCRVVNSIKSARIAAAQKTLETADEIQLALLVKELVALSSCLRMRELSLLLELLSLLAQTSALEESESAYYSGHIQGTISHLREMLKYDA